MRNLFLSMLREEYRFHTSYTSRVAFFFFPVITVFLSLGFALSLEKVLEEISLYQVLLSIHLSILFYGLIAGSIAFLGKEISEKKFGSINLLINLRTLPISFKKLFFTLYMREVVFYTMLLILPVIGGIFLSIPFTGFGITSVLFLFLSIWLSFLTGISFSFFASSIYRFSKIFFIFTVLLPISLILICIWIGISIESILPSIGFQFKYSIYYFLAAMGIILFLSISAILLVREEIVGKNIYFKNMYLGLEKKVCFLKNSALISKEFVDLRRSNTGVKMFFSFLFPLISLTILLWFVEKNVGVGFNIVSYGVFIGFFSLVIYSWLNNMDFPDFFNSLPVKVSQLIKARVFVHLIITVFLSTLFVIFVGIGSNEIYLIPIALVVMFSVSTYMVISVAYLTGLRINTYLFNPVILAKFALLSFLPLTITTIISLETNPLLLPICLILIIMSYLLYRGIDGKWDRGNFTF